MVRLEIIGNATRAELVRDLLRASRAEARSPTCFSDFAAEIAGLPGHYTPPHGVLLLLTVDDVSAGCLAVRPVPGAASEATCEIRGLYVNPQYCDLGFARLLVEAALQHACALGYQGAVLDTLDCAQTVQDLYRSLGFEDVADSDRQPASLRRLQRNLAGQ